MAGIDRLASARRIGLGLLRQPWATVALSGAATSVQLASTLRAESLPLASDHLARRTALVEPSSRYWQNRSQLAWT
jgi:hypothetical protein